ncbi:MAG: hypothetical protein Q8M22_17445 [Actinomycetota bacterium]|nr:hypothetical protein [Actinomycetota bacterium]
MPTHPTPASMLPAVQRERSRNRRLAVGLLIAAAVIWAAVLLVTGSSSEQRRQQEGTVPSPGLVTSDPQKMWDSSDQTAGSTVPADDPTAPGDEPQADPEAPADPEPQPDPQPDPDPDPDPQVPLGPGDVAPNPTLPTPTCLPDCVAPVELHPFELDTSNTPPGIDVAGGEAAGCSVTCITDVSTWIWPGTTDIEIEVTTHTAAFVKIWIGTEAPGVTPAGRPYFPGNPVAHTTGDLATWFSATLGDLEEDTKYWIIVTATDAQVRSHDAVGTVVTPVLLDDVELVFAAIDIVYDGDHGRNKGELDFDWNVGSTEVGRNGTYHRGNGSRIDLSGQVNSYARFDLGDEALPLLQVRGLEQDPGRLLQFCSAGDQQGGYGTDDDCGFAWNSTLPMAFTIDDIEAMSDCDVFDIGDEFDDFVCTRIATTESHSGIPEFSVVVAFRLF